MQIVILNTNIFLFIGFMPRFYFVSRFIEVTKNQLYPTQENIWNRRGNIFPICSTYSVGIVLLSLKSRVTSGLFYSCKFVEINIPLQYIIRNYSNICYFYLMTNVCEDTTCVDASVDFYTCSLRRIEFSFLSLYLQVSRFAASHLYTVCPRSGDIFNRKLLYKMGYYFLDIKYLPAD